VWSSLTSAHAYSLVSDYEGFPQSMLEAMASGLPVAVLDCSPAIRQVISDQVDGLVIPSEDFISSTLHKMLSSDSLRDAFGRAAFQRARDFEWKAIAPQWRAAITSLSSKPRYPLVVQPDTNKNDLPPPPTPRRRSEDWPAKQNANHRLARSSSPVAASTDAGSVESWLCIRGLMLAHQSCFHRRGVGGEPEVTISKLQHLCNTLL